MVDTRHSINLNDAKIRVRDRRFWPKIYIEIKKKLNQDEGLGHNPMASDHVPEI